MVFMAASASAPPTARSLKRIVAASLIGTTIEWYDNSSDQRYDLQFSRTATRKSAPNQHRKKTCWAWPGNQAELGPDRGALASECPSLNVAVGAELTIQSGST
ncbi:hypothetical protein [Streptomyces sp. NPDC088246]|uniref:hypothetical protein n=1 Tax=Streptomyces sp. NPDC088246 TaxID=3365842 RepID=UPI00381A5F4B